MAKFRNRAEQRKAVEESRRFHEEQMAKGWIFHSNKSTLTCSWKNLKAGALHRMAFVDLESEAQRKLIHEFGPRLFYKIRLAPQTNKRLEALQKKFPKAEREKLETLAIKLELEEAALARQFEKTG